MKENNHGQSKIVSVIWGFVILLAVGIILMLAIEKPTDDSRIKIPRGFKAREADGGIARMDEYFHSSLIMMVHGGIWDPASREQLKVVREIHGTYRHRGLTVFYVGQGDPSIGELRNYKHQNGFTFDFFPHDNDLMKVLGLKRILPHITLLDREGRVLEKLQGLTSRDLLDSAVKKHLPRAHQKGD